MRKIIFSIAVLVTFSFTGKTQTDLKTIQEIQTVLTYYLDGGTNGDSVMFSKAFVPDGQMRYMRNDTVMNVVLKDFMARMRNTGIKQDRKTKIENIQVFGNAASAKLTIEYPTFYFHDIMSLLKTKDGWKIAGKIFYREDKTK
ncbi:MAG TPA: nuclear transport factor 2 family protein [Chitinophagaceae bacterium]|nr:nuclear transport factor 2 family protein [Chitinophagaceae bacterium]